MVDRVLVERGDPKSILSYAKKKLHGELIQMRATRLMVVGASGIGKTRMIQRLKEGGGDGKELLSTDGVELGEVVLRDDIRLESWDFGGQKVFRITHQFFLLDYCVYAVLFRLTDPVSMSIDETGFWIESILSRSSKGAAIVMIGTHADKFLRQDYARAIGSKVWEEMKSRYNDAVVDEWEILGDDRNLLLPKALGGKTIDRVREMLATVTERIVFLAPASLEIARKSVMTLRAKKRKAPLCSMEELHEAIDISKNLEKKIPSLSQKNKRERVIEMLHQLGYIVVVDKHWSPSPSFSPLAKRHSMVVLDPLWATSLLATLITTRHSFFKFSRGVVEHEVLTKQLWRGEQFPENYHEDMVILLRQLRIFFPLKNRLTRCYFVPALLPEERPDLPFGLDRVERGNSQGKSVLLRRLVMRGSASVPVAVVPMLIVRPPGDWRNGAVLAAGGGSYGLGERLKNNRLPLFGASNSTRYFGSKGGWENRRSGGAVNERDFSYS